MDSEQIEAEQEWEEEEEGKEEEEEEDEEGREKKEEEVRQDQKGTESKKRPTNVIHNNIFDNSNNNYKYNKQNVHQIQQQHAPQQQKPNHISMYDDDNEYAVSSFPLSSHFHHKNEDWRVALGEATISFKEALEERPNREEIVSVLSTEIGRLEEDVSHLNRTNQELKEKVASLEMVTAAATATAAAIAAVFCSRRCGNAGSSRKRLYGEQIELC